MRFIEFFVLLLLVLALLTGLYFLWVNLPTETVDFKAYHKNISRDFPVESTQFYANMRYPDKNLGYKLEDECNSKKKRDFESAVAILEQATILSFHKSDTPDITVFCSDIQPKGEQKNHFIAGEGGPSEILNSSRYAIITAGEISLYRLESCDTPQVSIHEILHALGFNHNSNQSSILYPITNCAQIIDRKIIDEINRLYSQPSLGDLAIESVTANKTGRYVSFNVAIINEGLRKMENSTLKLISSGEIIGEFTIEELDIGTKRFLSVRNQRVPRNTEVIIFRISTTQEELTKDNNEATITALSS